MKRNGFIFVETIVVVVVLTASLLLLFSSFSKTLQSEKTRINYDDMAFVYRTYYLKERLSDLNLITITERFNSNQNLYFHVVGVETDSLFNNHNDERRFLSDMIENYDVNILMMIKEDKVDSLKKCTMDCYKDSSKCGSIASEDKENCDNLYSNVNEDMINYLKTIFVDIDCSYILAAEYKICNQDNTNCKKYYSWVSV